MGLRGRTDGTRPHPHPTVVAAQSCRAVATGRSRSRSCRAPPDTTLRRPTPARDHRARACFPGATHSLRRTCCIPRCFTAGRGAAPSCRSARGARPHLHLHFARSGFGSTDRRSRRGHVPRPNRRDRTGCHGLEDSIAPLHAGPSGSGSAYRPRTAQSSKGTGARRATRSAKSTVGLPIPHALPVCDGSLRVGVATASPDLEFHAPHRVSSVLPGCINRNLEPSAVSEWRARLPFRQDRIESRHMNPRFVFATSNPMTLFHLRNTHAC